MATIIGDIRFLQKGNELHIHRASTPMVFSSAIVTYEVVCKCGKTAFAIEKDADYTCPDCREKQKGVIDG